MIKSHPTPENPRKVRTLFMSDFHMGYKGFDARAATTFLQSHDCRILYLLGDIFDGWKLEKRWYWNQDYTALLDTIIDKKKAGVKIFYTPGNHDEKTRKLIFRPVRFILSRKYGFKIDDRFEHITANGHRYIALHGDQFDGYVVRKTSKFFDRLYGWFSDHAILPPRIEKTIEHGKERPWSLGKAIAQNGQGILNRFTEAAARSIMDEDVDGLIYGHSHCSEIKLVDDQVLANCGSWTAKPKHSRHHTAIVETTYGDLELVKWAMARRAKNDPAMRSIPIDCVTARHPETTHLIRIVHALWQDDNTKVIADTLRAVGWHPSPA